MNINSVDNSFNWSGTRKTETIFSKAGSFASKLNVAKKSKEPINQISLMGMCWLLHAARNLWYILTH